MKTTPKIFSCGGLLSVLLFLPKFSGYFWGGLIFIPPVLTVRLVMLVHRMELLEFNEKNNHLLAWRLSESKHSACKNPLCGTWRGNKGARKAHNLTPDSLRTTTKMRRKMRELTNFIQQITT